MRRNNVLFIEFFSLKLIIKSDFREQLFVDQRNFIQFSDIFKPILIGFFFREGEYLSRFLLFYYTINIIILI